MKSAGPGTQTFGLTTRALRSQSRALRKLKATAAFHFSHMPFSEMSSARQMWLQLRGPTNAMSKAKAMIQAPERNKSMG